ncbi:MAG: ComEC/Rec2 family competence protein [Fretibacterium sp.]|nr:ComEC/Rec2 family competence protein [Fretibacterium sp.]
MAIFLALSLLLALGGGPVALPFALVSTAGFLFCTFSSARPGEGRFFSFVLFCALLLSLRVVVVLGRRVTLPQSVNAEGVVVQVRPWGRFYAAAVSTSEGGYVVTLPFATLTEGTCVRLSGIPKPFRRALDKSRFDEELYWRARDMDARLMKAKVEPTPEQPWNFHRLRYALDRALAIHTPELVGAYLRAAWTGRRDLDLNEAHRNWGTSHLLAVSGYHVGVLMMAVSCLFSSGRRRVIGLSVLLWGYIFLTGAPASALRAGLMLQTGLFGELLGRPTRPLNSVSLAGALLLAYNPFFFWDAGWRLSILAALTIAALLELGDARSMRFWLSMNPLIWMVTYPQASYIFGDIPLAGILMNFIAPAFFSFTLSFASVVTLCHLVGFPLTGWLLGVLEGAFRLWGVVADGLAALTPWGLGWEPLLVWGCVGGFLALLCRALHLSWGRTAFLVPTGTLVAFSLFL